MNKFFGDLLRRELVQFIDRSELLRRRAESSGSRRLSTSSDVANNVKIPVFAAKVMWGDS